MAGNPLYSTRAWKRARAATIHRDRHTCQIRGPRCTTVATTADHIIELDAGGAPLDLANLRAACVPCNSSRGAAYGNRKREPRSEDWYGHGAA